MLRVVLIADAAVVDGLGHLSRSSALGAALLQRGAQLSALGLGLEAPMERYGVRWLPADGLDEVSASAIVLDSYRVDSGFRTSLRSRASLVTFDDDDAPPVDADFRIVSGPEHACLGPPFWAVAPHEPPDAVRRVLVTTGGGDVSGLGFELARELAATIKDATVALVRGPLSQQTAPSGVELVSAPPSLDGEFRRSDLVVCSAGQTLLEALATGLPAVATAVVKNQRRQLSTLAAAGAVVAADDVGEAITAAARLSVDLEARRRLASAARITVDGQGARRVADAVFELCKGTWLRQATIADAELLLAWRNDPVTRGFSSTKHKIREDEHRSWLNARLGDPNTLLWIALESGRPVGQVRLTRLGNCAEIHIGLAAAERGRGYARRIIRQAVERGVASWPTIGTIFATIDRANEASIRAFEAAGFRRGRDPGRFVLDVAHNAS